MMDDQGVFNTFSGAKPAVLPQVQPTQVPPTATPTPALNPQANVSSPANNGNSGGSLLGAITHGVAKGLTSDPTPAPVTEPPKQVPSLEPPAKVAPAVEPPKSTTGLGELPKPITPSTPEAPSVNTPGAPAKLPANGGKGTLLGAITHGAVKGVGEKPLTPLEMAATTSPAKADTLGIIGSSLPPEQQAALNKSLMEMWQDKSGQIANNVKSTVLGIVHRLSNGGMNGQGVQDSWNDLKSMAGTTQGQIQGMSKLTEELVRTKGYNELDAFGKVKVIWNELPPEAKAVIIAGGGLALAGLAHAAFNGPGIGNMAAMVGGAGLAGLSAMGGMSQNPMMVGSALGGAETQYGVTEAIQGLGKRLNSSLGRIPQMMGWNPASGRPPQQATVQPAPPGIAK